jgi:hypothetical protein
VKIRVLLAATLSGLAALAVAPGAFSAPSYVVRYRSQSTIYLDAGRSDGLGLGQKLRVVSGGKPIAELEVIYVADRSASTRVVSENRPVRAGDKAEPILADSVARAVAAAPAPSDGAPPGDPPAASPTPATGVSAPSAARPQAPLARLHGGVSLGYMRTIDRTSSGFDFEQRTARIDLRGSELGGSPVSFALRLTGREDIRARAFTANGVPQSEWNNRLYEAALRYESRDRRVAFEVGRIGVSYFSGMGLLDGASAAVGILPQVQLGGFFGRRADLFGLGFEGSGTKVGGFVRVTPVFGPTWRGEALLAAVHEEVLGDVSRDYASIESRLHAGTRLALFQRAEVDWNRGWRAGASQPTLQLSNISLNAQLRLWTLSSLSLSYDGRRRYRTYLDRALPEQIFDSRMKEGLTGNLMLAGRSGLRLTAGGGLRSLEGTSGTAYFASAGLAHDGLLGRRASVGLDASGYRNGFTEGLLVIARAGRHFSRGYSVEFSGGGSFYRQRVDDSTRATEWGRFSLRGELGRGVYLLGDGEYDFGDDLSGPRMLFELGWRF